MNIKNHSSLGTILGGMGLLGGIMYGIKIDKGYGWIAAIGIVGAVTGIYVGNSLTKFYE